MIRKLQGELRKILGEDGLSTRPDDLKAYGTDWSGMLQPKPSAIAFPRTTEQVASVLKLCSKSRQAVVPSGGRTGLSGGAIAARGELVLSLSRMSRLDPVDPVSHTLRVQAGATTQAVHEHCASHRLTWPVDFASKGSSQVGGNISTNAGGVRVIRYGTTRQWVLSVQLVTMKGDIFELNGDLEKNNTGYDLRNLVIGAEGTLGVVTEATLKLTPLPRSTQVYFFGVADIGAVISLFQSVRAEAFSIQAFETLSQRCYRQVLEFLKLSPPVPAECGAYVLLEIEEGDPEKVDSWLQRVLETGLAVSGTAARSEREAKELWLIRESVAEAVMHGSLVYQHDVSVPVRSLAEFSQAIEKQYARDYPRFEIFIFGHIGDGNLHIFIRKPSQGPELSPHAFIQACRKSDRFLFEFVRRFQGSVSAEHGIGLLKKNALKYSRSASEIALLKGIRKVFDPQGLLNPGKLC